MLGSAPTTIELTTLECVAHQPSSACIHVPGSDYEISAPILHAARSQAEQDALSFYTIIQLI